ncbi:MAG: hypothetical protein ACK5KT_08305 [Dysgonomonas sp.]
MSQKNNFIEGVKAWLWTIAIILFVIIAIAANLDACTSGFRSSHKDYNPSIDSHW